MTSNNNTNYPPADQSFVRPAVFADIPELIAAQSTRLGGVSPAPFAALNLGLYTADEPARVLENRRRFFSALGVDPQWTAHSRQLHGDRILRVQKAGAYQGYDALIADRPGLFCCVTVADCAPILVCDAQNRAVAAIHAGWRGAALQIVGKTLREMQKAFGTQGRHCRAFVGACIGERSYEVGEEVAAHFDDRHKKFDPQREKYFVDLKTVAKDLLLSFGLPESQIEVSPHCTYLHNDRYFSHRKEKGQTGRMLAIIGMKEYS